MSLSRTMHAPMCDSTPIRRRYSLKYSVRIAWLLGRMSSLLQTKPVRMRDALAAMKGFFGAQVSSSAMNAGSMLYHHRWLRALARTSCTTRLASSLCVLRASASRTTGQYAGSVAAS